MASISVLTIEVRNGLNIVQKAQPSQFSDFGTEPPTDNMHVHTMFAKVLHIL